MLPFLNMRLYRGNNLNLSKHIEKLKNNQLTIENVLEEDDIIQDLKSNSNSQFLQILTNEAIHKLIDYATKMPSSDDQKIGHKFPFNAAEILCADNSAIQERIMNEIPFKDSEYYEEEKVETENKEENSKEEKKEKEGEEEKKEEKDKEEKKEEENTEKKKSGFLSGFSSAIKKFDEKKEGTPDTPETQTTEEVKDEAKKEETEPKKEEEKTEEAKTEIKKEENEEVKKEDEKKPEEKKEEVNKEEPKSEDKKEEKKEEEQKSDEKKEENKPEKPEEKTDVKPEEKPEEKKEEKTEEKPKEEPKEESKEKTDVKPEEKQEEKPDVKPDEKKEEKPEEKSEEKKEEKTEEKTEEKKPEEEGPKEEKTEEKADEKTEDKKTEEETKKDDSEVKEKPAEEPTEKKEEEKKEEGKKEEDKKDEEKPEEKKPEEEENEDNEEAKKDNENEEDDDNEEKGQQKHFRKDDEDDDNQKENEENEDSEDSKGVNVYDNIDYLFKFLKEKKETITNHVLVGYFYKILNHLISSQSIRIVQYIFDCPYKNKFDVLDALVTNLNRKSMGSIVNKLLLFQDDSGDLTSKKLNLALKILKELEKCTEKDKYECICDVLASTLNNKAFYVSFMSDPNLVDLLFTLLEKSVEIPKKLIAVINLLIKVNENVLKNFNEHCTKNNIQENPLDFMALFNYDSSYPLDDKQVNNDEMDQINKSVLLSLFNNLKKNEFKFLDDLGEYSQDNEEFLTTYQQKQRKIGMKKIAQIEFLRSLLDIFVNSLYSHFHEKEIEELIQIIKKKNIFYDCHKLFFDFPFSNIYQTYYNQIVEIVLNPNSPNYLIECFFKYSDEKGEKNLVNELMDHFLNNMKFSFNSSNSSFNPCISYEITLLNKIYNCENEYVKEIIKNDKNLKVFDEVLGEEINRIFDQKLLLSDTLQSMGSDNEKPLLTFGKANFMQIIEEDKDIYNIYKEGKDYETKLNEKREREKEEREKMEQEIVGDDEENKDEQIHQDEDEENEEGGEENGIDKEEGEEGEDNNVAVEDVEVKVDEKKEEANEQNVSDDKKSTSTEESTEDKQYNDVNFWNPGIVPTDDIMNSIMNDIE